MKVVEEFLKFATKMACKQYTGYVFMLSFVSRPPLVVVFQVYPYKCIFLSQYDGINIFLLDTVVEQERVHTRNTYSFYQVCFILVGTIKR